jgi:hypothetical protein
MSVAFLQFLNISILDLSDMKKIIALFTLIVLYNSAYSQKSEALNWLTGTWTIQTKQGKIIEKWKILNDSTLVGKSLLVKAANDSALQETLELSLRKGQWSYISTVQGQNNNQPVAFPLIFIKGTEFISENPTHDFPQRISYRRINNQLFASIEGKKNGRYGKQNFDFVKQ